MTSWTWIVIALALVVLVFAARSRGGTQSMRRQHASRIGGGHAGRAPDQTSRAANDPSFDIRRDPHLEYQGAVYFFCSTEERDAFTANFQVGEHRPAAPPKQPRAIQRSQ